MRNNPKPSKSNAAKGASSFAAIPANHLADLNAGRAESKTLAEGLAVNQAVLLKTVLPSFNTDSKFGASLLTIGVTRRMAQVAIVLLEQKGPKGIDELLAHPSDTVRGWAAYMIAQASPGTLEGRLDRIKGLADDPHFGVREWAWLAVRPLVTSELEASIRLLIPWTLDPSENIRRFSVEVTRPRGVWSSHIDTLIKQPELGLPILENLKSDPANYVQASVGNWLNDASKSQPKWVKEVCSRWQSESPTAETTKICTRALRTSG